MRDDTTMSYARYMRRNRKPPQPMGDFGSVISGVLNTITGAVNKVAEFGSDPYSPELICRIGQLAAIKGHQPVPACQSVPLTVDDSIGLRKAMLPLRAYVYAEQHPWAYPAAAAAVVGLPFLLGYYLGKD